MKDRVGAGTPSQRRRGPLPGLVTASSAAPRYGDGMEMAPPQIGRALVVVVDDRVSHGEREDATGPLLVEFFAGSAGRPPRKRVGGFRGPLRVAASLVAAVAVMLTGFGAIGTTVPAAAADRRRR